MAYSHIVPTSRFVHTLLLIIKECVFCLFFLVQYSVFSQIFMIGEGFLSDLYLMLYVRLSHYFYPRAFSGFAMVVIALTHDLTHWSYPGFSTLFVLFYVAYALPVFNDRIQQWVPEAVLFFPYVCLVYTLNHVLTRLINLAYHARILSMIHLT